MIETVLLVIAAATVALASRIMMVPNRMMIVPMDDSSVSEEQPPDENESTEQTEPRRGHPPPHYRFCNLFEEATSNYTELMKMERLMSYRIPGSGGIILTLCYGSIIHFQSSYGAIVTAGTRTCRDGKGVDESVRIAAGPEFEYDRMQLPVLAIEENEEIRVFTGSAAMLGPKHYHVDVPFIAHAVGTDYRMVDIHDTADLEEADRMLRSAYWNALDLMVREFEGDNDDWRIHQVALPLISAGIFRGHRNKKALMKIAVDTIQEWCSMNKGKGVVDIVLFLIDREDLDNLVVVCERAWHGTIKASVV